MIIIISKPVRIICWFISYTCLCAVICFVNWPMFCDRKYCTEIWSPQKYILLLLTNIRRPMQVHVDHLLMSSLIYIALSVRMHRMQQWDAFAMPSVTNDRFTYVEILIYIYLRVMCMHRDACTQSIGRNRSVRFFFFEFRENTQKWYVLGKYEPDNSRHDFLIEFNCIDQHHRWRTVNIFIEKCNVCVFMDWNPKKHSFGIYGCIAAFDWHRKPSCILTVMTAYFIFFQQHSNLIWRKIFHAHSN